MKQILFISYDGLTDPLGQSQILPYLLGLTRRGYHFTILSCEKPQRYAQRKGVIEDIIKGYPVDWVPMTYHKQPPVLSSVYDYQMMWRKAKELHRRKGFSLVHTRSGIPTLVALRLKKRFGVRFLNDVRGFWADERVDGNMWDLKHPVYRSVYNFFKRRERECLRLNDYTTCLTYSAQREMRSWNLLRDPSKVEVIPCSVDLDLFDPARLDVSEQEALRAQLGIRPGDKVISYIGSIGSWYMIDEMMQFFKAFLKREPGLRFLMLINGSEHDKVLHLLNDYGLPREQVILTEALRPQVPLYLSLCDFAIFFIRPCFSKISSSPTKHGEIMAMGLPVVTNAGVGDVAEIVQRYGGGVVLERFDEERYAGAVDQLLGTAFDRAAIRQGAREFYDLDKALDKYASVYARVLNPQPIHEA